MLWFSHQVPFVRMSGEEAPNEVDPAAISEEHLQEITKQWRRGRIWSGKKLPMPPNITMR